MGTDTGSFELEDNVTIEYEVECSKYYAATMTDPEEGGFEGIGYEIVIRSEDLIHHMIMLGDLAANYTDEAIEKAAIEHWEESNQPEEDDREPPEFDHDSYYEGQI
jgi:hypothetical protein